MADVSSKSIFDLAICLSLILTAFSVYAQTGRFDFTNYDDPLYVSDNIHVQAGLTWESIRWAFTAVVASNWSPVTLLSHILDCQFFGMNSGMHHLVNFLLHGFASMLLFASLQRASHARWPSAFVAFVFALHPLHVESVAWIAERKDVLSAFFWFLTLYAYVRYAERPSFFRYLLVGILFCFGLLAKPMLVTLPATLLLFDVWPLRRTQFPKIVWEKLPLIALSAAASAVTFLAQRETGAVQSFPFAVRIENALISYIAYIAEFFWPVSLAVLYPYPQSPSAWQAAAAFAAILGVSVAAILSWRTRPYIATGWFWYLGTLVPVIGLVQVGLQARADRYMYIPMIGLTIILGWGAMDVIARWPRTKPALIAAGVFACTACMAVAWAQTEYWENSGTLFQHTIDVTGPNAVAHYNLGNYLMNSRHTLEAMAHFKTALRIKPDYPEAYNNLGILLVDIPGREAEAFTNFQTALRLRPDLAPARFNLGVALSRLPGKTPEAIAYFEALQRTHPDPEILKMINRLRAGQK